MPRRSKRLNKCEKSGKCGEIFHHNQSFTIICTSCDGKCFTFQEFTDHYIQNHVKTENIACDSLEFVKELSPTDLQLDIPTDEEADNEIKSQVDINQTSESLDSVDLNIPIPQHNNCLKELKPAKGLNAHIKRKEDDISKSNKSDLSNGFLCKICDKSYKTRRTLREHLAIHANRRSFVCDHEGCGKAFISDKRLKDHKRIHTGKRNCVCEICGYRTYQNSYLAAHVRTHTGEKPFPCNICGKHFISMSMVKEHAISHSTERRYKCDICNATFTRPKALYHHKPLHLPAKKFVCSICEKTYAQAAGLSAHMRKHKVGGKIILGVK